MRHTVCLTPLISRREPEPGKLTEMVPHCPTCGRDVPVSELRDNATGPTLEDEIKAWREDDEQGYDIAIDLLCRAETELRRLKGLPCPE